MKIIRTKYYEKDSVDEVAIDKSSVKSFIKYEGMENFMSALRGKLWPLKLINIYDGYNGYLYVTCI